jgi:glycosyltransferase involved in cell wall biosynthesis
VKVLLVANTSWYLYNFRLSLAQALRARGWDVVLVAPVDDFSPRFEQDGFRWAPLPMSQQGLNPAVELGTILALVKLYRQERPDIVHHFTVKCYLYGTLAAKVAHIPRVVNAITGLGYVFTSRALKAKALRGILKWIYRPILKDTEVVFQNRDDYQEFLKNGWITTAQTQIIPGSGVDLNNFQPSDEPQGTVTVLLPARMLWSKGVREFVGAARILLSQNLSARFVLVGDTDPGKPDSVPLDALKSWQAEGTVEWGGWEQDMAAAYRKSHIVCLPSYREGLPRVLIEAAACGRPIVTTDVPGCRDVVRANENGLLVPVRDVEALANALKTLILDPGLRTKMGQAGRRIAMEEYSVSAIVEKTCAHFYDGV